MQHGPQPGNSGGLEPSTNCSQGGLNWGDVMKLPKDAGQLHVLNAPGRRLTWGEPRLPISIWKESR